MDVYIYSRHDPKEDLCTELSCTKRTNANANDFKTQPANPNAPYSLFPESSQTQNASDFFWGGNIPKRNPGNNHGRVTLDWV